MQCAPFDLCVLFETTGTPIDGIAGLATDGVIGTGLISFKKMMKLRPTRALTQRRTLCFRYLPWHPYQPRC